MKNLLNKPVNFTLFVHSLVLGGMVIFFALNSQQSAKLGYINTQEVFADFTLTLELETRLNNVKNQRQAILDSMRLDLQVMGNNLQQQVAPDQQSIGIFNQKKQTYLQKEQEFGESNQQLTEQYNEQIAKQINQYVKEFGENKGFQFIYGADGTGSLMFAREGENVTSDAVAFINQRYQGLASK